MTGIFFGYLKSTAICSGMVSPRVVLRAMRLYGAFATLNVRFSNDKLLSMGMPKPPR
jgi:hypothetical protein